MKKLLYFIFIYAALLSFNSFAASHCQYQPIGAPGYPNGCCCLCGGTCYGIKPQLPGGTCAGSLSPGNNCPNAKSHR